MYILGIDVGGTKIEGVLYQLQDKIEAERELSPNSPQGKDCFSLSLPVFSKESSAQRRENDYVVRTLFRKRIPTEKEKGYASLLERIVYLCQEAQTQAKVPWAEIKSLGLGLPGSIDPMSSQMKNGSITALIDKPLGEDLKKILPSTLKINLENDANCFALAEAIGGAGRVFAQKESVPVSSQIGIGIILGTGCGGGAVIGGRIFRGKHGGAMEIGHTLLVPQGDPCYCGREGCAELYLSGSGLELQYKKKGKALGSNSFKKAFEIVQGAQEGDLLCQETLEEMKIQLQQFLANLTNIFDPDYFVLGGGLSLALPLYDQLEEKVAKLSFLPHCHPRVYQNQLGDSAGTVGAALLGLLE